MLRLYTFNLSHFSEKARWTLDYEGLHYEERVLVPGPHLLVTRRIAPSTEVPVLQHDDRYVQGSGAILDYIEEHLGGRRLASANAPLAKRSRALEQRLDQAFGLGVQRVLYSELLTDRATLVDLWAAGGPRWARAFYAFAYPLITSVVQSKYKTADAEAIARAKQRFMDMFDELDPVLHAQRYLGGDSPDRSDIAMAALLAPLCYPPEHRVKWPSFPPALLDFRARLEGRPTWNHALRMYREHR